jgi:hypothetical protein
MRRDKTNLEQKQRPRDMGWEYTTIQLDFQQGKFFSVGGLIDANLFSTELNRLGWDGWELVSTFDTNMGQGATRFVVAVLKRPLTAERREEIQRNR